MHKLILHCCYY